MNKFGEDCERVKLRRRRQHDARRTLISLARADGANKDALRAITHDGTGDVFDGYTTWDWPTLCRAISCLRIDPICGHSSAGLSHFSSMCDKQNPHPFEMIGDSLRGGRDSKHSTVEPVSSSFGELRQQNERTVGENPNDFVLANELVTSGVTDSPSAVPFPSVTNLTDFADLLSQAGETIRSGRLERFTAEWRERMAQVCEVAAEAVQRRLEGADKDTSRGDSG